MKQNSRQSKVIRNIEEVLGLGTFDRSTFYQKWQWQIITGAIATVLVVYFLFASGSTGAAVKYVTETADRGDLTVIVTATGTVQPTNTVDVSSELSGTIRKVLVDYNSKVTTGQVLAELDTDKLQASTESSRAKLKAANARVKDAEATVVEKQLEYNRKQTLFNKRVSAAHDSEAAKAAYDRALASVDSSRADVGAAAADLKLSETNLAKTCICSPINGIVLTRNVEPGQTVASSLQAPVLFVIAEDLSKMEVQVDVDEADVGKVAEGQKAFFTVDAHSGRKFPAQIKELRFGSEVVQGVVTYKAVLTTSNPELLLRPGMTATAEITVEEVTNVIRVPNAALRFAPPVASGSTDKRGFLQKLISFRPSLRPPSIRITEGANRKLYVLKDGEVKEINVLIGATDGKQTQIVKGELEAGQAVIVDVATVKN